MKSVFETLSAINVNDKVEKKQNLTYLSWAWAWGEVKKAYPNATYSVIRDPQTMSPYFFDQHLGYMVMTSVTINDETLEMWLPVMDGANQSMKHESYEYTTRYGVKSVDAATMFDINKTLMRCLTKNLAMFGLGHYIYAGEDLPEINETKAVTPKKSAPTKTLTDLEINDENWEKVRLYVDANKSNGAESIIAQLMRKYKLSKKVVDEINKIVGA